MRTERCVCGGPPITSETLKGAGIHVAVHNADPVHIAWRHAKQARDAYHFELLLHRPSEERATAGVTRDLSGTKPGASPVRSEGAA
jgi:hypothetical protein